MKRVKSRALPTPPLRKRIQTCSLLQLQFDCESPSLGWGGPTMNASARYDCICQFWFLILLIFSMLSTVLHMSTSTCNLKSKWDLVKTHHNFSWSSPAVYIFICSLAQWSAIMSIIFSNTCICRHTLPLHRKFCTYCLAREVHCKIQRTANFEGWLFCEVCQRPQIRQVRL